MRPVPADGNLRIVVSVGPSEQMTNHKWQITIDKLQMTNSTTDHGAQATYKFDNGPRTKWTTSGWRGRSFSTPQVLPDSRLGHSAPSIQRFLAIFAPLVR
jgi:hypothetical protein